MQDFEVSASNHNKRVLGCAKVFGFTLMAFVALSVMASVGVFGNVGQMRLPEEEISGHALHTMNIKREVGAQGKRGAKTPLAKTLPQANPATTNKNNGNLGMGMQQGPARHGSHASAIVAQGPAHHGSHASAIVAQGPAHHGSHTSDIIKQGPARHGSHTNDIVHQGPARHGSHISAMVPQGPHFIAQNPTAKANDKKDGAVWTVRSKPSAINKRTTPSSAPHTKNLQTPYAATVAATTKAKMMAKKASTMTKQKEPPLGTSGPEANNLKAAVQSSLTLG